MIMHLRFASRFWSVVLFCLFAGSANADIFQWEYIDPSDPGLGKQQSTILAPGGTGLVPGPTLDAAAVNLTQAYLSSFDLSFSYLFTTNLTNASLRDAILTRAYLLGARLTGADLSGADIRRANLAATTDSGFTAAQLYSTASYQAGDLSGINFEFNDLSGWNFASQDLTKASFDNAIVTGAEFSGADVRGAVFREGTNSGLIASQLYSTASYQAGDLAGIVLLGFDLSGWDFASQNLTGSSFWRATLLGTNFTGADVRGAGFSQATQLEARQLYSTASYQAGDLSGIRLNANDLSGWDFTSQNLTNAVFRGATLAGADFTNAEVRDADFASVTDFGFTAAQLYSTSSYQASDLSKIEFSRSDLSGWNFVGQDLSSAFFSWSNLAGVDFSGAAIRGSDFGSTSLAGAVLTGADARVTYGLNTSSALTRNLIDEDGYINTLDILPDETMRLWDLDPNLVPRWRGRPVGDVPILVLNEMSIASTGILRAVFEDDQWGSTITFDSGIPVTLAGTLELFLDDQVVPLSLVGTTFEVFDWMGVNPVGTFDVIAMHPGTTWDINSLYTTGEVTLIAVPEPPSALLLLLALTIVSSGWPRSFGDS